jgi:glycine reductase
MKPTKKLRIGNFHVKEIVFGEKTSFKNGVLTVNKEEAIAYLDPDKELKNIQLHIVHPGDKTRVLPTKSSVEPRFRPDGRAIFPGLTGNLANCGDGDLYAMKGISVISCGKYGNSGDGMLDMSGPGAQHSIFAKMVNLVVYAELINPVKTDVNYRFEKPLKLATHLLADYVAKTLEGQEPEDWEIYELEPGAAEAEKKGLPRVACFVSMNTHVGRENYLHERIFDVDSDNFMPVVLHPNCAFDGAVAVFQGLCGDVVNTYGIQNMPVLKRLYAEHGKTINLAGVIFTPTDGDNRIKFATALAAGELASMLNLDGAIVSTMYGGSNWDIDFFYVLAELEDRGIKTVGFTGEHDGKTYVDPKGDAIVTGGQSGTIFEFPPMDNIIGDLNSVGRDFYFGTWSVHAIHGPSLRPDGSIICNGCLIVDSTNNNGFTTKTVKDF